MANFFKGMLRTNTAPYCGDLEGPMTGLKNGQMAVTIEKGKCIAWIVGRDDVELSKETVKSITFVESKPVQFTGSADCTVRQASIYKIEMANGQIGTLRLDTKQEAKVKPFFPEPQNNS